MKLILSVLLSVFIFSGCENRQSQSYELTSVGALFEDQAATRLIQAERYEDALNIYVDMLEREPNMPQIHSNVGVILAQTQKEEEALKSWQHALKLAEEKKDYATLFAVNFNLGVYYGSKKNVDEALKHYQAALDIVPTSIETKTNIELLTQMQQQDGKGDSKDQKDQQDQNQSKDQKDQQGKDNKDQKNKDQQKDQNGKDDQKKKDPKDEQGKEDQKRESSAKYKPRPFKGDQLNENDVKKILGELRNQEQKIRANFDKKEQKDSGHEKDW
jgi:Ca-activated chloride channel homolog